MEFIAIIKRVGPFLLTFAAGLIVASFFVTVTAPSLNWDSKRSNYKFSKSRHMKHKYHELRGENMQLRLENEQLRRKIERLEGLTTEFEFDAEYPRLEPPAPPAPPKPFRHMQMKTKIVEAQ